MSNALQFEAIWRTAFQKKKKEDAYVRYVLFSVSADCRKYRLHQNGRLRQAAVHSALQDLLVEELIRLSHAAMEAGVQTDSCTALLADGLFTTLTNVNFDDASIKRFTDRVRAMRRRLDSPGSERKERFIAPLWEGDTDTVSLRSTLLFGLKGMAAYAHHAARLGFHDPEVDGWFYRGLTELTKTHSAEEWLSLIMEFGRVNYRCMELLDTANTTAFGNPVPTRVHTDIKKVPSSLFPGTIWKTCTSFSNRRKEPASMFIPIAKCFLPTAIPV